MQRFDRKTGSIPVLIAVGAITLTIACGVANGPGEVAEDSVSTERERSAPSAGPYLRILGTAQDGGLPHAACSCAHCERARSDPAHRRWVASAGIVPQPQMAAVVGVVLALLVWSFGTDITWLSRRRSGRGGSLAAAAAVSPTRG